MFINQGINLKKKIVALFLVVFAVTVPVISVISVSRQVYAEENIQKIELNNAPQFYSGIKMPEYDVSLFSVFSAYSSNSLINSTIYGPWSDLFEKYNCYGYALGRKDWCNIGQFSDNDLDVTYGYNCTGYFVNSLNNSIQELADYTVQDLHNLGYSCIYKTKNRFFEPFETQTLICVRKSKTDFHFMKYVDGSWLHKPGQTWILKYNFVPNVDEDWIVEAATMQNGQIIYQSNVGYPYTGDIYFIKYSSSHIYNSYHYHNSDMHEVTCNNCSNVLRTELHTFVPYNGAKPGKVCTKCGYILYKNGLGEVILKDDESNYEII